MGLLGRDDDVSDAATGVDVLVISTPDDAVGAVASMVTPHPDTLVIHLSGSLTLEPLTDHPRHGSLHPLASLPEPVSGAAILADHCPMALAGDPDVACIAQALGGAPFEVPDHQRALYHATAAVAANHVVALCAQVERLAAACGVPSDAFMQMMRRVVDNAARHGAAEVLTGPAARGDALTIGRHLDALPAGEHDLYAVLALEAARVAGTPLEMP
jgi:predicted short-subunit dehydrogenase-like oxidoreductase (DUF2520 family)